MEKVGYHGDSGESALIKKIYLGYTNKQSEKKIQYLPIQYQKCANKKLWIKMYLV